MALCGSSTRAALTIVNARQGQEKKSPAGAGLSSACVWKTWIADVSGRCRRRALFISKISAGAASPNCAWGARHRTQAATAHFNASERQRSRLARQAFSKRFDYRRRIGSAFDCRFLAARKTFNLDCLVGDDTDPQRRGAAVFTHEFHPCLQLSSPRRLTTELVQFSY